MPREILEIVAEVDSLSSVNPDDLDLDRVQSLADEYFTHSDAPSHVDVWFRLFERYPEFDGHGVFWTVLHGIEVQPGSDGSVVASVRRRPSRFPVLMVNRMLNAGIQFASGVRLLDLLTEVANDSGAIPKIREQAVGHLTHQRSKSTPI